MKFAAATLLSLALARHASAAPWPSPQETSPDADIEFPNPLNLTDSQIRYIETLAPPACLDICVQKTFAGPESATANPLPLCALTDQSPDSEDAPTQEDTTNAYNCIYSDRIAMAALVSCILDTCPADDIEDTLEAFYAQAWYLSGAIVTFPQPSRLLEELCIDSEGVEVPEALEDLQEGLGGRYTFAEDWPSPSVTTWIPPAFTGKPEEYVDTREPLTCAAAMETGGSGSESGSETTTGAAKPTQTGGTGNGTGTDVGDDEGVAMGRYSVPGVGMVMAIAGGVVVGGLGLML